MRSTGGTSTYRRGSRPQKISPIKYKMELLKTMLLEIVESLGAEV